MWRNENVVEEAVEEILIYEVSDEALLRYRWH